MAHEFVVVTPFAPDVARSLLEPCTSRRLPPRIDMRIVASVEGSNVHVRLRTHLIWWLLVVVPPLVAIGSSPAVAACLLVLAGVCLSLILAGTLEAKRDILVAVTDEPPLSIDTRKFAAVAGIVLVALIGFVGYRAWSAHRAAKLAAASFAPGTTRKAVIAALGWPDEEWSPDEFHHRDSDPPCASGAKSEIDYYGGDQTYCVVYLDAQDRVVCAETSVRFALSM